MYFMKFALIRNCDCFIDIDRTNVVEQITTLINDTDYVSFIDFTQDDMYQLIYDNIGDGKTFPKLTLLNLFDTKYDIYVAYFTDKFDIDNSTDNNSTDNSTDNSTGNKISVINNFASQMTSHSVVGNMMIFKMQLTYKIDGNNIACNTTPTTLSIYDLIDVTTNIFAKTGLIVDAGKSPQIVQYKYIVNPLEPLIMIDPMYEKKYRYHDYEIFDRIVQVVVSTAVPTAVSNNDDINEIASWICNRIVNGKVYIGMYKKPEFNENPPFVSITNELLNKIVMLRKKSITAGTMFAKSPNEYANFEMLLDLEIEKHKNETDRQLSQLDQNTINNVV